MKSWENIIAWSILKFSIVLLYYVLKCSHCLGLDFNLGMREEPQPARVAALAPASARVAAPQQQSARKPLTMTMGVLAEPEYDPSTGGWVTERRWADAPQQVQSQLVSYQQPQYQQYQQYIPSQQQYVLPQQLDSYSAPLGASYSSYGTVCTGPNCGASAGFGGSPCAGGNCGGSAGFRPFGGLFRGR